MSGEEIKSNVENLQLYSDTIPHTLSLRIRTFESESDYKKFVKNVELLVRRSNEYKLWRNYVIEVLGMQNCVITNEGGGEVTVDLHHHIPSLFVVVKALVNKKIENAEEFCSFDIAKETIELHFKNKIGYVALIKSMHEKFHNGFLDIPINSVKGDYKHFIEKYAGFLDEQDVDTINLRLSKNNSNCNWSKDNYPIEDQLSAAGA
jgi:hypothetical protein